MSRSAAEEVRLGRGGRPSVSYRSSGGPLALALVTVSPAVGLLRGAVAPRGGQRLPGGLADRRLRRRRRAHRRRPQGRAQGPGGRRAAARRRARSASPSRRAQDGDAAQAGFRVRGRPGGEQPHLAVRQHAARCTWSTASLEGALVARRHPPELRAGAAFRGERRPRGAQAHPGPQRRPAAAGGRAATSRASTPPRSRTRSAVCEQLYQVTGFAQDRLLSRIRSAPAAGLRATGDVRRRQVRPDPEPARREPPT